MRTTIEATEGGVGISLPPSIVTEGQFQVGSELEITIRDGNIVLSPLPKSKPKLEELVAQITDENMHELVDWGPPVGGEVW